MDGRALHRAHANPAAEPEMALTGTLLGPLLLVPFLCQLDSCVVRKEWYAFNAFGAALVVLGVVFIMALKSYARELGIVLRSNQGLIGAFVVLSVTALFGSMLPEAFLEEGLKYVLYPTADAVLFTLAVCASVVCRRDVTWRLAASGAMGMIVASIVWDSIVPGTFSELSTRAAGFGVNPNTGGAIVGLLLIGLLDWERAGFHPFALMSLGVSGLGVFLTLSRSALLCWGVVMAAYFVRSLIVRGTSAWLASTALILPAIVFAASAGEWARESIPMLQASHQRIEAFLGGFGEMDHADDSRVHLAEEYFDMAMESPWVGWGTGLNYATEDGAHNIYLARWVENGLVALGAVIFLVIGTYRGGRRTGSYELCALAAYVFVQGFFSHNLLEDKSLLLMWGILAGRGALRHDATLRQEIAEAKRVVPAPAARPWRKVAAESSTTGKAAVLS